MKGLSDQGFVGSRVDQDNVGVAFTSDAPLGGHRLWARSYPWGDFLLKMQCEMAKASRRPALPGSVIRVFSQLHGIGQRTNPLRTPSHVGISHAIDTDRELLLGESNNSKKHDAGETARLRQLGINIINRSSPLPRRGLERAPCFLAYYAS